MQYQLEQRYTSHQVSDYIAAIDIHHYTHYMCIGSILGSATDVRLVGGRGPFEGRVEVFFNGQWGTVCDDSFDNRDGLTICKYLGFPGVACVYPNARFGRGTGPIFFDDMSCRGDEYSPYFCAKRKIGTHNCGHNEDAGVQCQSKISHNCK